MNNKIILQLSVLRRKLPPGSGTILALVMALFVFSPNARGMTKSYNTENFLTFEAPEYSDFLQELVTGTVTDENGIPLPGASIVEEGTSNGVVTDFDGNFQISVANPDATLVISYMGYKSQKLAASQDHMNITMEPDATALEEVVVVGYGTTVKRDVTGAVSSVTEDDLNQGAITNPLQQLVGKAAGVIINQTGS